HPTPDPLSFPTRRSSDLLGGTNLRIAAVDQKGRLIEKVTLGTKVALGRSRVVDDMCDAVLRMFDKYHNGSNLLGIGIGVPGIIEDRKSTRLNSSHVAISY